MIHVAGSTLVREDGGVYYVLSYEHRGRGWYWEKVNETSLPTLQ